MAVAAANSREQFRADTVEAMRTSGVMAAGELGWISGPPHQRNARDFGNCAEQGRALAPAAAGAGA